MLNEYFKSIVDQDRCAVVICNSEHVILYMNKTAIERYSKRGGDKLIGKSLLNCHNEKSCESISKVIEWFEKSKENNIVHTFFNEAQNKDGYMVALRDGEGRLIGYYEKHEFRTKDETPFYDLQ